MCEHFFPPHAISGLITEGIYCAGGFFSRGEVRLNDAACRQIHKRLNLRISAVTAAHFSHCVFTYTSCTKLSYRGKVFTSVCACEGGRVAV